MNVVSFADLPTTPLIVDAVYEGSHDGLLAGEPLSKLLPGLGNMGGFRPSGRGEDKNLVVLFSTGEDKDWPDTLDLNTGQFTYFGDNKTPGHEIHETQKGGNKILRRVFELLHASPPDRSRIPPFLIINKHRTEKGSRSVQFKGIAVPGYPGMSATEDLVAVWKTTKGQRFQNYKSVFTVLDVATLSRDWVTDILAGDANTANAPDVWRTWVDTGHYQPLKSEPTTIIRSELEQTPNTPLTEKILGSVWAHFDHLDEAEKKRRAFIFERFAARIFQMHDHRVIVDEITRGVADGGRDAIGRYLLGLSNDPVYAEFSLEAKCYRPGINGMAVNRVGVKEVSRLISRIRHRQFGVLVTTSVVHKQAYQEVREDRHPIVFISGRDIADILIGAGYNTQEAVARFLQTEFPV
jgi:hypothetical protein